MAKIREAIGAAIRKIESEPSMPAGVYFGVYMVSWAVAALSATHLVDPKCRLLAWLVPSSTFIYEDVCRWMDHVVLAAGVVVAIVIPFAMLCAGRFRAFLKTLLTGFGEPAFHETSSSVAIGKRMMLMPRSAISVRQSSASALQR